MTLRNWLESGTAEIEITDIRGRLVYRASVGGPEVLLNLERLEAGMYYLSIIENKDRTIVNFIKE